MSHRTLNRQEIAPCNDLAIHKTTKNLCDTKTTCMASWWYYNLVYEYIDAILQGAYFLGCVYIIKYEPFIQDTNNFNN